MGRKTLLLVILVVLATNILTFLGTRAMDVETPQEGVIPELDEDFQLFQEIVGILEADHLDDIDRKKLLDGAFRGMLKELDDPQASYLDPEEYENLRIQTEGTYGGVGIEVFYEDDYVTVVSPISGTPGERAGLSTGDRIIAVDGKNLVGEGLTKAINLMRGEPGTDLKIEVERPGVDGIIEFNITREKIELTTVKHQMFDHNLGYIKLTNFSTTSPQEFQKALEKLKQEGMAGLVVDLRNNPGGSLDSAILIADMLVPEGPITHVVYGENRIETHESRSKGLQMPMVVLVNKASSSASEVLAGALQDTNTATLIGTQTFGKASVQNIRGLSNEGALRFTVAQYQTPDGRTIHEKGLTPDIKVEPPYVAELAMEPISVNLVEGDEGKEVETLQKILSEFSYFAEEISGYFDLATREALKEFQRDRGISITGEMSELVVRQLHDEIENRKKEQDNKLNRALELLKNELK